MTLNPATTRTQVPTAQKLGDLYRYWARRQTPGDDPGMDLLRDLYLGWGQFATEAEDVSFKTVDEDGIRGLWAKPGPHRPGAVLYLHGGGYIGGSAEGHRKLAAHIAQAAGLPVFVLDYRLAPEHPYPAALEDSLAAYEWILAKGAPAERVAVVGDSAGGALATAVALHRRDAGLPRPGAVATMSPFYDVEAKGRTFETNAGRDALAEKSAVGGLHALILGEGITAEDPYLNALKSDPAGLPPVHIAFGGDEALLSGGQDFAELARGKGVEVELEVYEGQQHVFQFLAGSDPDADDSIAKIGAFLKRHIQ
ncbi:alpha/beta hydrolase [Arthrobacter sp. I2-34]|uniref:Alpha/beta hydrolase n=1 Tax=Arthrobacter hankyongi TaxID=2904801 RepID=A0ABS9L3Q7_9MICC|nr:alpha/beta hydrolase [Arthrobacter hankyongi]MCG2621253.1 alpha/beta hydrolase [Arthrobacter hankyongi]